MKLGTNTVPVYWSEKGNCKVIKVGVLGDNFGDVQNIETLKHWKSLVPMDIS
jgi:hypothetical protein